MRRYGWCIWILVLVLVGGCRTVHEADVERVYVHDTVRSVQVLRDSIVRMDSVWVERWTAGDTVYVVKDRWAWRYKEKVRVDTLYQVRDSVVYRDRTTTVEDVSGRWKYVRFGLVSGVMFCLCLWIIGVAKKEW